MTISPSTTMHKVAIANIEMDLPTVSTVQVAIDYAIIEHFSQHLYGSPNKAIEELVSNSFDAFASKVFVYIPGKYTTKGIVVWDDGKSMNETELHRLWWIAQSPKAALASQGRVVQSADGQKREMIGKFGIGKLASYSVGRRITHICRRDERFLLARLWPFEDEGR